MDHTMKVSNKKGKHKTHHRSIISKMHPEVVHIHTCTRYWKKCINNFYCRNDDAQQWNIIKYGATNIDNHRKKPNFLMTSQTLHMSN